MLTTEGAVLSGAVRGFAGGFVGSSGDIEAALRGGLTGAAFGFVGGEFTVAPMNYVGHAVVGCLSAEMEGGKCGPGAAGALLGKIVSSNLNVSRSSSIEAQLGGGIVTALAGAIGAQIAGGDVKNGALTAAFGYLFNQLATSLTPAEAKAFGEAHAERMLQRPGFDVFRNVTAYVGDTRIEIDRVFYNSQTKEFWTAEAKLGPSAQFTDNQRDSRVIKALNTGDFRVVGVQGIDSSRAVGGQVAYSQHHIVTINATRVIRSPVYQQYRAQGTQMLKFWWRFGGEQ